LQETATVDVWAAWQIVYRDVVVVGPDNRVAEVFNLTQNNLGIAEDYAALKDLLLHVSAQWKGFTPNNRRLNIWNQILLHLPRNLIIPIPTDPVPKLLIGMYLK
jgi:hypothetical protein